MAEEELRENKRQWMAQVQEETNRIVREDAVYPLQSFVQVQVLLSDMVAYEVNPDAFEDLKDKEDVVLLWRKLKASIPHWIINLVKVKKRFAKEWWMPLLPAA